ncbi:lytic polysaccharide monooxygenase [Xylariaceae sp. FL1019]|nr:lytic polysaccharide monooxygenase [Xylariaceae sp. FL1019]
MMFKSALLAAMAAGSAIAHMNMKVPPPLEYKGNPNAAEPNIDYTPTAPLSGSSQFPCKGGLKLIGTPEGASVATYSPGQQTSVEIEGGAFHNGGSCQLSLSYDKGSSFTVIKSFIGGCPTASGGTFNFQIPSDAPTGDDVVLAWTWNNKVGNREFYMSCAVVTIGSGGAKRDETAVEKRASVAFADRPAMFRANLDGDKFCVKEGIDVVYPEPGPDVENAATSPGAATICATGEDAPMGDGTSSGGSGSGSSSSAAPQASSSSAAAQPSTSSAPAATSSAAVTPSGGVFFTSGGVETATTLATQTSAPVSSAPASSSAPAATSSAAPTSVSSAPPASSSGASAAGVQTGACSSEGQWNCIDGSSFQRCASGQWSVVMPLAAGTKCSVGMADTLNMRRRREKKYSFYEEASVLFTMPLKNTTSE